MYQMKQGTQRNMLLASFLSAGGGCICIPVIVIAAVVQMNPWAACVITMKVVAAALVYLVVHSRVFRNYGGAEIDIIACVSLQSLLLFLFIGPLMFALWHVRWIAMFLLGLQVLAALNVSFWFYALTRWLIPDIREAWGRTA
ncbi:hypothetical protein SGO26_30160 (plasmid) [Cupriavidus metallidurans]|uniref:hypothetical protein n=1 Tax=Cupriavidus metallidurans TaxID=119219 RepID=UPI003D713AD2